MESSDNVSVKVKPPHGLVSRLVCESHSILRTFFVFLTGTYTSESGPKDGGVPKMKAVLLKNISPC